MACLLWQSQKHAPAPAQRTALLDSSGMPLMGTISLEYLLVSLPVWRLKPVNWMVAPSTLSISDPTSPAANPALLTA